MLFIGLDFRTGFAEMDLNNDSDQQGFMSLDSDMMLKHLEELAGEYEVCLRRSIAEEAYIMESKSSNQARDLAERLGIIGAGPKELIDLHRKVLLKRTENVKSKRGQAFVSEARYFLLQMMGELTLYYRRQSFKNNMPKDRQNSERAS